MCQSTAHSNQFFNAFVRGSVCSVKVNKAIQLAQEIKATLGGQQGHLAILRLEQGLMAATNEARCLRDRHDGNGELEAVRVFITELGKYPRVNIRDLNDRQKFSSVIISLKASAGMPISHRRAKKAAALVANATTESNQKNKARKSTIAKEMSI